MSRCLRLTAAAAASAVLLSVAGCATSAAAKDGRDTGAGPAYEAVTPAPAPPAPTAQPRRSAFPAYAAVAVKPKVAVYDSPGGRVVHVLDNPRDDLFGMPLTFRALYGKDGWTWVSLPVPPNSAMGWVRTADIRLEGMRYRLDLLRSEHRLLLYDMGRLVETFPVGIGKTQTPTPGGTYFLIMLVRPDPPTGPYGPYAFGLNAYPPTIEYWNGKKAIVGLHGTDDESSVGRDVSHGCIRLHNRDITRLARLLPLGTPVRILK